MLTWIRTRILQSSAQHKQLREQNSSEQGAPQPSEILYATDLPISSRSQDRFNRWQFAERIARTLAERSDPSSLVVGLYGPWGDGKTSVLQLMQEALKPDPDVVVVRFNPWYFQSEEKLLLGFFATLAEALGQSLPDLKEHIGQLLAKYGSILSLASITVGGVVNIAPGAAARDLGQSLSIVELDSLKSRVEGILSSSRKRVVVLIDDIDRLDRHETHALLKLVKLSAGFSYTRYVLAFDDEMVAAAIGDRYGEGNYEAGRNFLDKIVQVPLHLPPADLIALRRLTLEGVQAVLNQAQIELTQAQTDAFLRHFVDGLEPGLDTPRRAKVYANALAFTLPLLKGEVHPVDLMLIEGIRVFYPKLYAGIRDNQNIFLSAKEDQQADNARRQEVNEVVTKGLAGKSEREVATVRKRLLETLFPRISKMGYGHEWDRRWSREQRICSAQYFNRFFAYGVPPGDVSDLEVAHLLERITTRTNQEQNEDLHAYAGRNAYPQLIRKLREREEEVPAEIARPLALAVARNGALAPKERGNLFVTTSMQAAILVSHLLRRLPGGAEREALAVQVTECAEPLPFGFECLRWVLHSDDRPEELRIVSRECEATLKERLTDRIRLRAETGPLFAEFGRDTGSLLWLWNDQTGGTQVGEHLSQRFAAHPEEVDEFLDSYVGEAWGLESGLPRKSDFDRNAYDAIAKLLDPEVVMANLRARYGSEIDAAEYHYGDEVPTARRIAFQFAHIHRRVKGEQAQAVPATVAGPPKAN